MVMGGWELKHTQATQWTRIENFHLEKVQNFHFLRSDFSFNGFLEVKNIKNIKNSTFQML